MLGRLGERVTRDGSWHFRGDAVILKPYDGLAKPSTFQFDTIEIWVQIHDVPPLYAHPVPSLAAKVGEVLYVKPQPQDFIGNFHRVWLRINVNKPLRNAVSMIRDGKRQIYRLKYEKLPDWCAVCGMLGHQYKEHGTGIHPPSFLVFKDLRASWVFRTGQGPGGGRGRRGGRRGGRAGRATEPRHDHDKGGDGKEGFGSASDTFMDDANNNRKRAPAQAQHVIQPGNNANERHKPGSDALASSSLKGSS